MAIFAFFAKVKKHKFVVIAACLEKVIDAVLGPKSISKEVYIPEEISYDENEHLYPSEGIENQNK